MTEYEIGYHDGYSDGSGKIDKLKVENAKLRELCLDLWASCPVHDEDCQVCKHYDGAFCDLYTRIEKLEVTA